MKSKLNKGLPFHVSLVSWERWLDQPGADFQRSAAVKRLVAGAHCEAKPVSRVAGQGRPLWGSSLQGPRHGLAPLPIRVILVRAGASISRSSESCIGQQSALCPHWNSQTVLTSSQHSPSKHPPPERRLHMFSARPQWGPSAAVLPAACKH